MGTRREAKIKSGEELKSALCTACGTQSPANFSNVTLNTLLDFAKLPRDDPRKDPLEMKQMLGAMDKALGKLSLKQRKAMEGALEAQTEQCKRLGLPEYFDVPGGWPPKAPEPEPPRKAPTKESSAMMLSPTPLSGEGDGFTWTQTEQELSITVCVPENTQKQEVMMQCQPKFGPAQQIAPCARFWPLPLLSGTLHFPIDASEATWHLDTNNKVTIDLPKIEEQLWPGTPPVFTHGPGPLERIPDAGIALRRRRCRGDGRQGRRGRAALVAGVAPESVVQKMGQRPNDLQIQLHGCALLSSSSTPTRARRSARRTRARCRCCCASSATLATMPEVQLAAWRALITLVEAQPFLRKVLMDQGGMKLVLAGLEAHRADEAVLTQLAVGCRSLLPATPPRPFVEAAGLELLVESINAHPNGVQLGEVAGSCLHMLSAVNNIVRRMILRMEVLKPLLEQCDANKTHQGIHEVAIGLTVQLSKGDQACMQLFAMQMNIGVLLPLLARFPEAGALQADGARALATLLTSESAVLDLIAREGLTQLLGLSNAHGESSPVGNEVVNVLEQAVCAMCEAVDEEAPDDELDAAGMVDLLNEMAEAAHERKRAKAEAKRKAEDEARIAAEAAEAARREAEEAERSASRRSRRRPCSIPASRGARRSTIRGSRPASRTRRTRRASSTSTTTRRTWGVLTGEGVVCV